MIPVAQNDIEMPPFANAGTISVTAGLLLATATATAVILKAGDSFVLAGYPHEFVCQTVPVDIGAGVYEFNLTLPAPETFSGIAWAPTVPVNEETMEMIIQQEAAGNTAGRSAFDTQIDGFVYLDTQASRLWERNGPDGTWTDMTNTLVIWVSTTGDDNDGDVSPYLKTIQRAVDTMAMLEDTTGWNLIIALKPGTYNESVTLKDVSGVPLSLKIIDHAGLQSLTASFPGAGIAGQTSHAVSAINLKSIWMIEHVAIASLKGHGLLAKASRLRFNRCDFMTVTGAHISALGGGHISLEGDAYRINVGGNAHLLVNGSGAVIDLQAEAVARPTITIVGSITFKTAFAWARASGQIFTGTGLTFINKGGVTGRRWRAEQNSSIDSGQSGEKYLPGTVAGVAVKSGEYL